MGEKGETIWGPVDDAQRPPAGDTKTSCSGCLFRALLFVVAGLLLLGWVLKVVDDWNNDAEFIAHLRAMGLSKWVDEGQLRTESRGLLHLASDSTEAKLKIPASQVSEFEQAIEQAGFEGYPSQPISPSTQAYPGEDFISYSAKRTDDSFQIFPDGRISIRLYTAYPFQMP